MLIASSVRLTGQGHFHYELQFRRGNHFAVGAVINDFHHGRT